MAEIESTSKKQGNPAWKAGVSGNPEGRPKGSRNKFGEQFVTDFLESWEKHGKKVLEKLAKKHPKAYATVAVAVLPKVIEFDDETKDAIRNAGLGIPFAQIKQRAEETDAVKH
jgi:hypothetical protein